MIGMNILIIEDDEELLENLKASLEKERYRVETETDGRTGLDKALSETHDLILLDIMLPNMNGLELLKEIREGGLNTPLLILTARGDLKDKVLGLDLGADDYLAKPFSLPELLARIRALMRRDASKNPLMQVGNITLNTVSRAVLKNDEPVTLTPKEFSILEFLFYNQGRVVSRFHLAEHVWGEDFDPFSMSNFLDVHIKNLRKKLHATDEPSIIKTVRSVGYQLD